MNETTFAALEYAEICRLIGRYAQTPMGKAKFENLTPLTNRSQLEKDLKTIAETIFLNEEKQVSWNFSSLQNPSDALAILRIRNAVLEPLTLLELSRICHQAIFARSALSPEKDFIPNLWEIVGKLPPTLFTAIDKINKTLLPGGEVNDLASAELAKIRREINHQRGRLQKLLETAIRNAGDAIQDALVTQRNDRYVIPVKADFRGKIAGVAHDFSSSGATVFIEPLEAIEANNELQNLKGREEREIARILSNLTDELREQLPAVEAAIKAVTELDFIRAKVEFARAFGAIVPTISDDETLELLDARHPLLEENLRSKSQRNNRSENFIKTNLSDFKPKVSEDRMTQVVPNSLKLTREKSVMIISGANAGGKTVVLKTAGLLSLMAISALPVPAKRAQFPFYKTVLADIGDHQSLSANLSTFSSHMSNIAEMMKNCSAPALVLLDEVGTGTDPDEGSALGVAIVDFFRRQCKAHVIASTHYRGLKIYAANDENVVNASVEFDEKTLQPTYRLIVGLAGASSGLEIARRFGIFDEVIENARKNLDSSAQEAESFLKKLQTETRLAEDLRLALEEERETVAQKYALLEKEFQRKEKERRRQFEHELAQTVADFERQTKAFIEKLEDKALRNKLEKERLARKAELNRAALAKLSRENSVVNSQQTETEKTEKTGISNRKITVGAKVQTAFGIGKVEKIEKGKAEVIVGAMRLREKPENLRVITETELPQQQTRAEKLRQKGADSNLRLDARDFSAELNLIGKTTAEAEYELDKFLDEAYLAGIGRARVIHGFGTGALKNFVHHFLKGHPHVERFSFAPSNQGGNGATIVDLKD
jgi:DNA mismatch repair protein MutS2